MNEYTPYYTPAGTTNINYTTNASRQYPTYRVTRTIAQPIVVSREDLIKNLAGATDQYKQALADYNDLGTAVGASVDKDMIMKALSKPENKGRLESEMSWAQALSGGLMQGFKSYNDAAAQKMNMYKNQYDAMLNEAKMIDELKAREEAAAAKNAELNKQVIERTEYTDPIGGSQYSAEAQKAKAIENKVERESAAVTAADVWNTVDQHPNHFSEFANNDYFGWMTWGDDRKRRGWVAQQAPQIGGVELQKLQDMMPKGFSGAINSAVEQRLMMPVREAMMSGIGSKIKPAIETYLGGYYDELQKEYAVQSGGKALPFTKEQFITSQLTTNARQYNTDYDPSNPTEKPMFLEIKKKNSGKDNIQIHNNQMSYVPDDFYKNKYGATVVMDQ